MGVSSISTGFPVLSQSSGQVAHVLLTRSPLGLHRCCHRMDLVRLACIKHAASVRPEPGSNSPSRLLHQPRRARAQNQRAGRDRLDVTGRQQAERWRPKALLATCHCCIALTYGTGTFARSRPHWLLALALPFSRNDQALAPEERRCRFPNLTAVNTPPGSQFVSPCVPNGAVSAGSSV